MKNMPKVRCSHILLSWDQAIESTHSRDLIFAVWEAKQIIESLKSGGYSWAKAVKEHSACPLAHVKDGDLGWFDLNDGITPEIYYSTLACPIGELLDEPIESPYGVHIITRTG